MMCRCVAVTVGLVLNAPALGGVALGPSPYLSFADSPFQAVAFDWFFLEDFEDGLLNSPGVSPSAGIVVSPGVFTDSVDGDDGSIDGSGTGGHSYYSANAVSSLSFTFDAFAPGGLPTHAGIVWTDVGTAVGGNGFGGVMLRAFDADGVLVVTVGPSVLGDGNPLGGTEEDRFFGAVWLDGILRIEISMDNSVDWEVDHLQYGRVPAPGTPVFLIMAGTLLIRRTRHR